MIYGLHLVRGLSVLESCWEQPGHLLGQGVVISWRHLRRASGVQSIYRTPPALPGVSVAFYSR